MIKNEKGSTLIFTLMVFTVIVVLAFSLIFLNNSNFRQANREEKKAKAYYVARTGADALAQYIAINPNNEDTGELLNKLVNKKSSEVNFGDGKFNVEVTQSEEDKKKGFFKITSKGSVNDVQEQTSVVLAPVNLLDIFGERAIFSNADIKLKNKTDIQGLIQSKGSVTLHDNNDKISEENIESDVNIDFPEVFFPKDKLEGNIEYINDTIDATGSNKTDFKITAETLTMKGKLIIKTSEHRDIVIVAKNLNIEKDGNIDSEIKIEGLGKVYFYVANSADIGNSSTITVESKTYAFLYLKEGSTLELKNGSNFKGYIYGPSATVNIRNDSKFTGTIIAKSIDIPNKCDISRISDQDINDLNIDLGVRLGYKKIKWQK